MVQHQVATMENSLPFVLPVRSVALILSELDKDQIFFSFNLNTIFRYDTRVDRAMAMAIKFQVPLPNRLWRSP